MLLATLDSVPGHRIREILSLVDGSSVVSPGFSRGISGAFSALGGGQVREFEETLTKARALARKEMIRKASELEADAVLGLRYETSDIGNGICEIIVYGTAVRLEKSGSDQ